MQLNDVYKEFIAKNIFFECIEQLDKENILGWLKTIDAFSNTKDGILFIGVEDKTNKLISFKKIMDDYKNEDISHKPFIFSKNNQFSIVLPDLINEDGITLDDESLQILENINNGSKYDISILAFCYNANKSIKDITNYLNVSNSTFFRKKIIMNLVLQNFLIEKEEGNTKTYYTNHDLVLRK